MPCDFFLAVYRLVFLEETCNNCKYVMFLNNALFFSFYKSKHCEETKHGARWKVKVNKHILNENITLFDWLFFLAFSWMLFDWSGFRSLAGLACWPCLLHGLVYYWRFIRSYLYYTCPVFHYAFTIYLQVEAREGSLYATFIFPITWDQALFFLSSFFFFFSCFFGSRGKTITPLFPWETWRVNRERAWSQAIFPIMHLICPPSNFA